MIVKEKRKKPPVSISRQKEKKKRQTLLSERKTNIEDQRERRYGSDQADHLHTSGMTPQMRLIVKGLKAIMTQSRRPRLL